MKIEKFALITLTDTEYSWLYDYYTDYSESDTIDNLKKKIVPEIPFKLTQSECNDLAGSIQNHLKHAPNEESTSDKNMRWSLWEDLTPLANFRN